MDRELSWQIRELITIIGFEEYKTKYKTGIEKIAKDIPKALLYSLVFPIILLLVLSIIISIIMGIVYKSVPSLFLVFMFSFFIAITAGIFFGIKNLFMLIIKLITVILTITFELVKDGVEKADKEMSTSNIIDLIRLVAYGIVMPKIGKALKGGVRAIGFYLYYWLKKFIDSILKDVTIFIEESVKNKEMQGYIKVKMESYREILDDFIGNEMYDLQGSLGKYAGYLLKQHLTASIEKYLGKDIAKKIETIIEDFKRDKDKRETLVKATKEKINLKNITFVKRMRLILNILGGFFVLWGGIQILLLFLILNR